MAEVMTLKVPSSELAARIAAVTENGSRLATPFLAFAAEARRVLCDFEAEVTAAGIEEDEEQLQDAAEPLLRLHHLLEDMTGAYCDLLAPLGGDVADDECGEAA